MLASLTLGLTAAGLSGDAFAASVARGAVKRRIAPLEAVRNGLIFGGVEGLMCLAGWLLAFTFAGFVTALDHWIALVLLSVIGGKMILDSLQAEDAGDKAGEDLHAAGAASARRPQTLVPTLITAMGTSIDSAAVGIALSLSGVSVIIALVVGLVSAAISTIGFLIGPLVGAALGKRAELLGGLILVGIGVSIWLSHVVYV
ncbi:MAG: manganese efflux pump MntP family protein [Oceanicaulis sp.]